MKIKIASIAHHVSDNKVSSGYLDLLRGKVQGSTEASTGVRNRHILSPNQSVAQFGAVALSRALDEAEMKPGDLDLLISAAASYDFPVPHNSAIIKSYIADDTALFNCFDVDATCLSFVNALEIACLYIQSGRYNTIAIVTSESASPGINPDDDHTFGLFGDAAVAVILQGTAVYGFQSVYVDYENYCSGAMYAKVPIGGAVQRFVPDPAEQDFFFQMKGKELISLTLRYLPDFVRKMEVSTGMNINDFDAVIAHQTSKFGNMYFEKSFLNDNTRMVNTLEEYGNCIAASIPLGLEKWWRTVGKEEPYDVLLIGSAAGVTLGCMALRFS